MSSLRGRVCLRGLRCLRVRVCLRAGTVFRGRLCLRAGTSDRCAPAVLSLPPLRGRPLPFTKPRAATPSEVPAHPAFLGRGTMLQPLGWRDCLVLASWLHRFASLGLKSRIDARIALVLTSWLHRFASLGLKSRITARFLPRMAPRLQRFASLGLKSRIDAAPSCRQSRTVPPAAWSWGAGGDRTPRRRHNPK